MVCTYTTIEFGTCGAPGASPIPIRKALASSVSEGRAEWITVMRHKVLCPAHHQQGIAEGWIVGPARSFALPAR